jgi:TetR/AcrR family transcriptional regulator, cholesterol catabolism regulator
MAKAPETPAPRRRGRPRLTEPTPEYLERRESIIDAAARAFHARGYDAASLDDVVAELDIRKASLYHYVNSKAQLLYLIFDRAISRGLERLDRIATIPDPRERLATLIFHQVELIAEEPSLFSVFFDNRPRLSADYEVDMRAKERRYLRRFAEAIALASREGAINDVDPRYGAQAILGMTSWIYKWFDPETDNWRDIARSFVRLVLGADVDVDLDTIGVEVHRRS